MSSRLRESNCTGENTKTKTFFLTLHNSDEIDEIYCCKFSAQPNTNKDKLFRSLSRLGVGEKSRN